MIITFGSLYMDVAFPVTEWPARDTVVAAGPVSISPGGKGGNQAMAAGRTGSVVYVVGKVGNDSFGNDLVTHLRQSGVMTSGIGRSELPTGVVGIIYEPDGTNGQVASPGANREVSHEQIPDEILKEGTYIMTGLSLPREQIETILHRARGTGCVTVLNVSPVKPYMSEIAPLADILVVNLHEMVALAEQFDLGEIPLIEMIDGLVAKTGRDLIVTLGGDGVVARRATGEGFAMPAYRIDEVVDTTGAGDCFVGFFVGFLKQGMAWNAALARANIAAGLACREPGAMESFPYLDEVLTIAEGLA